MFRYNVYTKHGALIEANVDASRAAFLLDVNVEDLEWAIDAYGVCESVDAIARPL